MTDKPKKYRYKGAITVHSFDDRTDCYNVNFGGSVRQIPREVFDRDYEEAPASTEPNNIKDLQHVTDNNVGEINGGWLPIDENTPKETYILLYAAGGFWSGSEKMTVGTYENWHITATHWQPLPTTPASEV